MIVKWLFEMWNNDSHNASIYNTKIAFYTKTPIELAPPLKSYTGAQIQLAKAPVLANPIGVSIQFLRGVSNSIGDSS